MERDWIQVQFFYEIIFLALNLQSRFKLLFFELTVFTRYKPAVHEFGYQKNNGHCNCWLTKRDSDTETERMYSTAIWEPQYYPEKYSGEEATFVSFAAHHIHIHEAALVN